MNESGDRRSRRFLGAVSVVLLLTAACTSTPDAQSPTTVSSPAVASSSSTPTGSSSPAPASTAVQTSAESPGPDPSSTAASSTAASSTAASSTAASPGASITRGSGSPTAPSSEPAQTSTVPAPGGTGNVEQTVPTKSISTRTTAALSASAAFGTGVSASITSVRPITVEPIGPGESAGPALQVTIRLTNGTRAPISLDGVGVDLTDATGVPATQSTSPPANLFAGSLAPGAGADGVYVFHVATTARNPISIDLNYSTTAPIVLFRGDAS